MSDDHDHEQEFFHNPRVGWVRPYYTLEESPTVFRIYEGSEEIPSWANAVCIDLDGKMKSDLNWSKQIQFAKECSSKGIQILWNMDLGLFDRLQFPLKHQGQYQSLGLALEHFRKAIWTQFENSTFGISLYRGNLVVSDHIHWDEEQIVALQEWISYYFITAENFIFRSNIKIKDFKEITPQKLKETENGLFYLQLFCREITREYLDLLLSFLPETIQSFALYDVSQTSQPLHLAMLTVNERDRRIHSILSHSPLPLDGLGWNSASQSGYMSKKELPLMTADTPNVALCLPPLELFLRNDTQPLEIAIQRLLKEKRPFRLLSEATITAEWDGLDEILIYPEALSAQGSRMLKGFLAAGGKVTHIMD